ncbi:MAG: hypothetical protein ACI8Z9_001286 [Paraglaciecola sp.]
MKLEPSVGALQSPFTIKPSQGDILRKPNGRDDASKVNSATESPVALRSGGKEAFVQADSFRKQPGSSEKGSFHGQYAIEAYETIAKEQRRGEIQLLLGVDTYI